MTWRLLAIVVLAGVLAWAGVAKTMEPEEFLVAVANFRIVEGKAAWIVALYVPWLEIALAVGLLLPRWRQVALLLSAGLLSVFTVVWAITWVRGLDVSCGCFGGGGSTSAAWAFARAALLSVLAWCLGSWCGGGASAGWGNALHHPIHRK